MDTASSQRVGGTFLRAAFSPGEDTVMSNADWMDLAAWWLGLDPRAVMDVSREGILAVI
jgi:hypothetical protein